MPFRIPINDIEFDESEFKAVQEVLESGWLSEGEKVDEFETSLCKHFGVKHAVAVDTGTAALHIAVLACGIGKGDEVIVPSHTFASSANCAIYAGATPVFADIDIRTLNISPDEIEKRITDKTKAIVPVHYCGHPCEMDRITEIAEKHNLAVIEDACQAHGASFDGGQVGTLGKVGCFSLFANKTITTGEGGFLLTNEDEIASHCHILKQHGREKMGVFVHKEIGFNYKITEITAALGIEQLKKLSDFSKKRIECARLYREKLEGKVQLTKESEKEVQVPWRFPILVDSKKKVFDEMRKAGVEVQESYYPLHLQPCYKGIIGPQSLPVAEEVYERTITLPVFPKLGEEGIDDVCDCLSKSL